MLPRPSLLILASCALCGLARADKFYLRTEGADAIGNARPYIEGVLIRSVDSVYEIRIEGGEITVPKSLIVKIEKDDLTVEKLVEREENKAQRLRDADTRRREVMAAEAVARREARARAAEQEAAEREELERARQAEMVQCCEAMARPVVRVYDPVLDVSYPAYSGYRRDG